MTALSPSRGLAVLSLCGLLVGCYASRTRPAPGADGEDGGRHATRDGAAAFDGGQGSDVGEVLDSSSGTARDAGPDGDASSGGLDAARDGGAAPAPDAGTLPPPPSTDPNLRVAFLGDQGLGSNPVAVLELIRDEGADMVLHQGDFDYADDPSAWLAQLDGVLGRNFPYFGTVGNHDLAAWDGPTGYQALLEARLANTEGAVCTGRVGVRASCTYRGLFFVTSGVGTLDTDHETFLAESLAASDRVFKLCSWHKNQHDMQVGAKTDEVGWEAYQICQQYGALIVTGHEHSYSRTFTLTALGEPALGHGVTGSADLVTLMPGSTAVVVAGLGGHSRRAFLADHADDTWWAAIYALDRQVQNGVQTGNATTIEDGALFVDFHVDGDPRRARAYFKTPSGAVTDSFDLVAPAP